MGNLYGTTPRRLRPLARRAADKRVTLVTITGTGVVNGSTVFFGS